jgi:hypothetical protein
MRHPSGEVIALTALRQHRRLVVVAMMVLTLTPAVAAVAAAQPAQDEVARQLRVEWRLPGEEWTRPRIVGHVYNDSSYRVGSVRLRVEILDAASQPVRSELAWIYVDVPARSRASFSVRRPAGGTAFRLTVESFVLIARERPAETP